MVVQLGYLQDAAGRHIKIVAFGDYQCILLAVSDQKQNVCSVASIFGSFSLDFTDYCKKNACCRFILPATLFFFFGFVYWFCLTSREIFPNHAKNELYTERA